MRIGIFDPYLDDIGGGEKYMMTLASCLSKDNEVYVFWDDQEVFKNLTRRFSIDLSKVNFYKNIFSSKFSFIQKIIETKKFDIIIFLSDGSIPVTLSNKTFIHIQQPLPNVRTNLLSSLKLKRINAVFCNSTFTKSFADKELGIQSKVLYPSIEIKARLEKKENYILHVGRFRDARVNNEDYKRQGMMVQSFKEMIDGGFKDWKFVLCVGLNSADEENFNKIKEIANGYPIEFLVNKSNDELWDIYSKAKIYWHATGFGEDLNLHPEFAEHFGISTVEAMGAGCVPVVINAGGQKEIITDGENGYLWNSIEELKKKTIELAKNERKLNILSIAAKKRAEYFAGERFCRELKEIILE
ncbi:MAG: hypothetical protein A3B38_02200 [Candidatus Levybacteria bacterium RIFCSPLOWO2_01_FULL_36_13]|nr:MAG: hypothetical protein A2684_03430 [Candidatus Levybacteria bacterium RIFCSPHIGHO2_01_FULL_36_15b]OGH35673.1 MAG: hypothetical protein A3B38_02200 [Candidatus Levybacteria bacterium RIFCSPLOWO2_01_FULL_36_13]